MKTQQYLFFILVTLFHFNVSVAGSLISIDKQQHVFIAPDKYYILHNPDDQLSIEAIQLFPIDSFDYTFHTLSPTHQHFWLRLDISNEIQMHEKWLLSLFNHVANRIEVYTKDSTGTYRSLDTVGIDIPFYDRKLHTRIPTFEVSIYKGINTIYIKYYSQHYMGLNTVLQKHVPYINFANKYYFLIGGFYFLLVLLILYNTLFYFSTRDKIYLHYILFVIAALLDCIRGDQLGFAFLWPNSLWINSFMNQFARLFFIFATVNYTTYFLQLKQHFPFLRKVIWILFTLLFTQDVLSTFDIGIPYQLPIATLLIITLFSLILYTAIKQLNTRQRAVRLFMVGFSSIYLGVVISYLFYNQLIEGNHFVYYIMFYGITIDTIMFSFALSARLKKEREDKEAALEAENQAKETVIFQMQENDRILQKVNKELESKVQERTSELEDANQKLQTQSQLIQALNQSLDKENWNLNKEIKKINTHRILAKNQSFQEVLQVFPDKASCYRLIADLKWANGFSCKKCLYEKAGKGTDFLSKRCTKCGTLESVTSHTLFHKLKFPIEKAFYLTYVIFNQKEGLNLSETSREIKLSYQTCSRFRSKVETYIESRKKAGVSVMSWEEIILDS